MPSYLERSISIATEYRDVGRPPRGGKRQS